MSRRFSRLLAAVMLAASSLALLSVSFDAEARRMGGGLNFGRQSSNVITQRKAITPPASSTTRNASSTTSAAAGTAAAGTAARSGMSRFLGPLAGIAAGLGIAALLSHLGLSGAFLEFLSSFVLIALVAFAVMFLLRRLRGAASGSSAAQPAAQAAGMTRQSWDSDPVRALSPQPATPQPEMTAATAPQTLEADAWFIPQDFDTPAFLARAKAQFVAIQKIWDSGDLDQLSQYLTDDLIAEFRPQIQARQGKPEHTEVVLLNAELLGIEAVAGGHLASVRYSGMLREAPQAEAFHFEEVWNLYKADGAGWLLAGIQQIPVQQ